MNFSAIVKKKKWAQWYEDKTGLGLGKLTNCVSLNLILESGDQWAAMTEVSLP